MSRIPVHDEELRNILNNRAYTVFSIRNVNDAQYNWIVKREGVGMPEHSYRTKRKAKKEARSLAKAESNRPAVLVSTYANGTVEDWWEYT